MKIGICELNVSAGAEAEINGVQNSDDFPLSPGPMRQLTPGDGSHANALMPRKFSIEISRIRAIPAYRFLTLADL